MLGPLEVVRDSEPVDLPGGKARMLLAALLVNHNHVVSTDRLFEVLWGAAVPDSAQNLLQTYVSRLRDALEPEPLRRVGGGYLVTREPGYVLAVEPEQIDAVRLEQLAGEGRRALAGAPAVAAATLRRALAPWRGDPLPTSSPSRRRTSPSARMPSCAASWPSSWPSTRCASGCGGTSWLRSTGAVARPTPCRRGLGEGSGDAYERLA
jgi:hypothetical protein